MPTADKIAFVDRLSAAGCPVDRGVGLREPEVGAADGRRGGGLRRASRGGPAPATPRWCRTSPAWSARPRPASARSRSSRPPPRRSAAGTSTRRSTSRSTTYRRRLRAGAGARLPRARLSVDGVRLPVRGRRRSRRVSANVAGALLQMGAFEVAVSDTIGIAHPGQVPRRRRGGRRAAAAASRRAALPRHARHGARQRADGARPRRRDLRRVGRRPRRLPVRAGRDRQPRHRGPRLHARRAGHRDRRQPGRQVVEASAALAAHVGHAPPSRYAAAVRAGRASTPPADRRSSS